MRKLLRKLSVAISAITMVSVVALSASVVADDGSDLEEGRKLAFNKKKGNCLACHLIAGGDMAGNIAPPLVAMKARFPDIETLKAQISDARIKNPISFMPPFKPHGILTSDEIDKIAKFIHSL
jgi:sulfur-oxidizing protein SoxX